ncbi:MAG: insulinase family protein [Deltaproteobacteria bacterium]|jgi:predicted Zn-dependent peptidase|nr:insulinase family protein [Deltaproteobacteria bacterium]
MNRYIALIFSLLLVFFQGVALGSTVLEDKVFEHRFDNGLKLLVVERHDTPVVSAYITIGVGSVHETSETRGVAHLLEHMLFKGTKTLGTTDYTKEKPLLEEIERVGSQLDALRLQNGADQAEVAALEKQLSELQAEHKQYVVKDVFSNLYSENGGVGYNAFTSKDLTTYLISLPSNKLELWALIESDRMKNPVLREFYTERDVIREERRRSYDTNPARKHYESLVTNAFKVHPYRNPIIGWHSDIANLSPQKTREFLEKYYAPVNTVIALVGDIRAADAVSLVDRYFGDIAPGTPAPRVSAVEPVQKGEKRILEVFDAEPRLAIAWHKPTMPDKDDYAFDLIDQILGSGRTSRLYRSLVEEQKLATSVSVYGAPGSRYPNLFVIEGIPRHPHTVEELESAIYAELDKLKQELVEEEELTKVRNRLLTDQLRQLRSNSGLARLLTSYQSLAGDWRYVANYAEEIDKLSAENLKQVANRYLTKSNRTVVVLQREDQTL